MRATKNYIGFILGYKISICPRKIVYFSRFNRHFDHFAKKTIDTYIIEKFKFGCFANLK